MKIGYNWLIIATICGSTILGCFLYCLGFSRTFSVINKHSSRYNPYISEMYFENDEQKQQYLQGWFPKATKKIFLYLVDSLRYDQVTDIKRQREELLKDKDGKVLYYPSKFTSIIETLNNKTDKSLLIRGVVDTQTMTITRIKALTTGTIPSFMSMFDQISSEGEIQDNLFYQLKQSTSQQEVIYLYGVDLWNQYFQKYFDFQRLNINSNLQNMIDNSPIYNDEILKNHFNNQTQSNWTFFINHDGGIDSLMHGEVIYRFEKPFESPLYQLSIDICNNYTKEFIEKIDDDTTFILFSDHGFTNYGTHGGKEIDEKLSVIFGYDKRGFIKDRNISQKMDKLYLDSETDQIDLLATLCMLKGIAIPSNNIGVIIPDFFLDLPTTTNTVIANAYYTNMRQIEDYFDESMKLNQNIQKKTYENIQNITKEIKKQYKKLFKYNYKINRNINRNLSEMNGTTSNQNMIFTGTEEELSSFISSVFHLSHVAKEAARNEGEVKLYLMYFSFGTLSSVLIAAISYIFYNDTIVSHNYTSSEKHLSDFLLLKFLVGSFFVHLAIFFMFSGLNVLLLLNIGSCFILILFAIDSLYSRFNLNKKPKHILKKIQWFSSFKLDFETLLTIFILGSFSLLFIKNDRINELDYYIFIITIIVLGTFLIQLVFIKGKIFSSKIKILLQIISIGLLSFFCMHLDPFINKDEQKYILKTHLNALFMKLLKYQVYNTVIPLIFFSIFYFYQIKESLKNTHLNKKSQFVIYLNYTIILALLVIYFVAKNVFHDKKAMYFFRNFFPLSSYILVLILILFMNLFEKQSLSFFQKYKIFLLSFLPSLLYLMDYQCISLIIFFFVTIQFFHNIIHFLNYRSFSLIYSYLTILSFQYFYVSGHKFAFEFMHLHTHAVGLFIHSDFFSNINVFVGNYSFFFIAFLIFPIILYNDTQYQSQEKLQQNSKETQDLKQKNFKSLNDESTIQSRENINIEDDSDNIIQIQELDQNSIKQEGLLNLEQQDVKKELLFSKSLIYLNLPILLSIGVSFFRNIYYPLDNLQESYQTIIIFLTTIFLLSSISAQIHIFLQATFSFIDFKRKYLKIN